MRRTFAQAGPRYWFGMAATALSAGAVVALGVATVAQAHPAPPPIGGPAQPSRPTWIWPSNSASPSPTPSASASGGHTPR